MAVIEGGQSGILSDVGANTRGMRVEGRPIDVGALGAYQISVTSGTMAAGLAGGSTIFSARWGDATRSALIRRVSIIAQNAGTAFTAGLFTIDLTVVRGFTVSDSAQTGILPFAVANTGKKRSSFGTTLFTDLRISATGAITVGTRVPDTVAMATFLGAVQAVATNYVFVPADNGPMTAAAVAATGIYGAAPAPFFEPEIGNSWPVVLTQDTGFIIRVTVPATGTWRFNVNMEWAEVLSTAGYN